MAGYRRLALAGIAAAMLSVLPLQSAVTRTLPASRSAAARASSEAVWLIPATARLSGENGSFWTTDLTLANLGESAAPVTLRFLGHDEDGRPGPVRELTLGGGETRLVSDVLGSLFGLGSGYGAIRVTSPSPWIDLKVETSTPGPGGSYGHAVPALPREDWIEGTVPRVLGPVSESDSERTNLVLVNGNEAPLSVTVALRSAGGTILGGRDVELAPWGMTQLSRVIRGLGIADPVEDARLELSAATANAAFVASAVVIDTTTNDPRTLLPQAPSSWLLPASARGAGAGGSFWTTDVTVSNTGTAEAHFELKLLVHDEDGRVGPAVKTSLPAGQSRTWHDAVQSLFAIEAGHGAVRLTAAEAGLSIQARTSTPGSGGTYGQSVPAAASRDLVVEGAPRAITGIREDGAFRTNLVLANATDSAVEADVELRSSSGSLLATRRVRLEPASMTQLTRVVRELGVLENVEGARVRLSTQTAGGAFAAYASSIDERSQDPRTLLSVAAPPSESSRFVALVNGTLFDGTGAAPVPDGVLLVRDGRIAAAGTKTAVRIPDGARVIDVRGGTILPGIINAHVHGAYVESNLRAWARAGVTTVRDLHTGSNQLTGAFATRDRTLVTPELARVVAAGSILTVPGGYPTSYWGTPAINISSAADARVQALGILARGADVLKIALESGIDFGQPGWPMLSREETRAIGQVARENGTLVSVHVEIVEDLARALDYGADDIAHMVTDPLPDDVLVSRIVREDIVWVPTLELWDVYRRRWPVTNLRRFVNAGGRVALGTDFDGAPERFQLGMPMREMELMESAGMTRAQVLVAATRNAARVCNRWRTLGTLEAGKVADVLVVRGDPLADLHALAAPALVMRSGVVIREE